MVKVSVDLPAGVSVVSLDPEKVELVLVKGRRGSKGRR
jgi:hypothetical protein